MLIQGYQISTPLSWQCMIYYRQNPNYSVNTRVEHWYACEKIQSYSYIVLVNYTEP